MPQDAHELVRNPRASVRDPHPAVGQPITVGIHETGLALAERYSLSIYDAMVAASALHAECDTLWSEDMHDGMVIQDQLRIANSFRID